MFGKKSNGQKFCEDLVQFKQPELIDAKWALEMSLKRRPEIIAANERKKKAAQDRRRGRIAESIQIMAGVGEFRARALVASPEYANEYGTWADETDVPWLKSLGFRVVEHDYEPYEHGYGDGDCPLKTKEIEIFWSNDHD